VRFALPAVVAHVALAAACSGDKDSASPPPTKPSDPPVSFVASDAGPASTGEYPDPGHAANADPTVDHPTVTQPLPDRERKAIDITLRSSPPGARVAVDGTEIGIAPAFWSGYADGRQHEFSFTLPRHAVARYRFVPVASGVIHARLEPIAEERDAGVAPPPEVVQHPPASAVVPPQPPPTIVPADAALAPPPKGSGVGPQP
jgi:hypothetical protein